MNRFMQCLKSEAGSASVEAGVLAAFLALGAMSLAEALTEQISQPLYSVAATIQQNSPTEKTVMRTSAPPAHEKSREAASGARSDFFVRSSVRERRSSLFDQPVAVRLRPVR